METKYLPYLLGMALFAIFFWVDLQVIQAIFDSSHIAIVMSLVLLLECMFVIWHGIRCKNPEQCSPSVKRSLKYFSWVFSLLSVISILVFLILLDQPNATEGLDTLKIIFSVIFALLTGIGISLVLAVVSDDSDTSNQPPTPPSNYGKAGYRN